MRFELLSSIALLGLAPALPSQAVEINLPDYSLIPDGQNLATTFQNTNVNTLNGGTVLPASGTPVVYVVSRFIFGSSSDAHLQWQFHVNETSAPRLGVEVQDTGLVQFIATGDSTRTSFNFAQDMAGQTVTLLAKLSYDANNNVTYGKSNAADDTIMNVWINPTGSDVEGAPNSLAAGDMSTIWNSAGFNWFRQIIQNQNTPETAGTSSITNTTILTGADATFANALSLAIGGTPPDSNFQLVITPNGANYDFAWNSLEGKLYDLVSSTDLATPIPTWPVWDGKLNIPPTPPINTLTSVTGDGDKRFFAVIEKDAGDVDLEAPALSQTWGSGSTITLVFSEAIDADTATDPANYSVTKDGGGAVAVTGASLGADGKTVTLTLGAPLDIASSFAVAIANVTDLAGNPVAPATVGNFQTWDNDPDGIQVFVLAGQSNMVGYGKTEDGGNPLWTQGGTEPKEIPGGLGCLRYLAINNASFPDYDYTSLLVNPADPANSAWKTRGDVKVWWRNGHSGNLGGEIGKGNLGPPFRGANTGWFGPEYAFGQVIGDYYSGANERPVLIVKAAWGGRSLGGDFRPPSAVADRGGVVGPFYLGMFADVREVLGDLEGQFPADQHPEFSAVGYRYRIAGIGWHQGWNDGAEPLATEYKDNLPDLIGDLRAEFGNPDLPFTIASTGMGGNKPVEPAPYPNYTKVEKAQLWVAGVAQPSSVLSRDTRPYWRDAAISPSTLGFHWNHNGESYFLVGKSLADNMKTLLDE
jgi:alpha-galactosidase